MRNGQLGAWSVGRVGYGAMQLAGPGVMGPPRDRDAAVAVLRRAVELGVRHLDTSDYYGPHVVNEIIAEALRPYPDDLVIVTKVGSRRSPDGGWPAAMSPDDLRQAVRDNLDRLGVDAIDVVNLRMPGLEGPQEGSLAEPLGVLADLRDQGLVKELGVSNVTLAQYEEARALAPVVCVQNLYNIQTRTDDPLLEATTRDGVAFVPFFPLGGWSPVQSEVLHEVAARHDATDRQIALAWLLHRAPNVLLIPGTSSVAHLESNLAAGGITLTPEDLTALDAL